MIRDHRESSPLLRQEPPSPTLEEVPFHSRSHNTTARCGILKFFRRHVITILYLYLLIVEFGNYLQAAPRAAIYEEIICHAYGLKNSASIQTDETHENRGDGCKGHVVQDELAFVRGMQEMFECLPGACRTFVLKCHPDHYGCLLLAMPYGHLANKYSRKLILFVALVGMCLQYSWVLVVVWFSHALPLRLVWLSSTFLIIGGGQSVSRSLAFVIVSDVIEESKRATYFFHVEAVALIARAAASALSSLIMENDLWLPMILGLGFIYIGSFFALLLPVTRPRNADPKPLSNDATTGETEETSPLITSRKRSQSMWIIIWKAISEDRRVVTILGLAILGQLSSRTTGLLLQYAAKRYDWSFSRANMLLVLRMVSSSIALFGLIPILTTLLPRLPSLLQPFSRDLFLARVSTMLLAVGLTLIASATKPSLMVVGVTVFSLGFGAFSALRSVLTTVVLRRECTYVDRHSNPDLEGDVRDHISILYAAMSLGQTVAKAAAGPLYAILFQTGQRLGVIGQGLPFAAAAVLALIVHCATWFLKIGT